MHLVDAMDKVLRLAKQAGYRIRQEWLGGSGGGGCEIRGQKFLFLDLSLTPTEQFEQALEALRNDANLREGDIPAELRPLFAAVGEGKRGSTALIPAMQHKITPPQTAKPSVELAARKIDHAEAALRQFTANWQERKTA